MQPISRGLVGRARDQFGTDLRSDPYLRYILLLAALLAGFWFWHRAPQFATHDAFGRLHDPMIVLGALAAEGSSLKQAVLERPTFGATFYLYGIALIPAIGYALLTGQFDSFSVLYRETEPLDRVLRWNSTPEWLWTSSILLSRLLVVLIAVGCVYLTYRIGTELRDRSTGRLAAILLSISWGFLISAHEIGEDIPALFVVLCVLYLALRYATTGEETVFLAGCLLGGVAIAVKLTAGAAIVFLGGAYVLHGRHVGWREALVRPRLLGVGFAFGLGALILGFPDVIVAGIDVLIERIDRMLLKKSPNNGGSTNPIQWWIVRGYLHGLGLSLSVAALCAVPASLLQFRERSTRSDGIVLLLIGLLVYLLAFSRFAYVKTHHLLPTLPLLCLLVAVGLVSLYEYRQRIAGVLIAGLVITTGVYAVAGDLGYATQPRDQATAWLNTDADENASIEKYMWQNDMLSRTAIPHSMDIYWYGYATVYLGHGPPLNGSTAEKPSRIKWMLAMPERCPEYIQLGNREMKTIQSQSETEDPSRWGTYLRELYNGDTYPYDVVKEFGPPPATDTTSDGLVDLLSVGVIPWSVTYGDPQDFKTEQYTVILKRTGRCETVTG